MKKKVWGIVLAAVLLVALGFVAGRITAPTNEPTAPTTEHAPTTAPAHTTEPAPTTAPTIEDEYIRKYGSADPLWLEFIENEATVHSHNRWDLEVTQDLFWAEVQERMQRSSFLSDAEEMFFISNGYKNITANGIPAWKLDDEALYPEMYYPFVVVNEYGKAALMYVASRGHIVQLELGQFGTYCNLGEAHPDPLECDWGGDGYTPEQMRNTDSQMCANAEVSVVYNEGKREICIWSRGDRIKSFEVPEGFRRAWNKLDVSIDEELQDNAWVFTNDAGKIWLFQKLDTLKAYENYEGGEFCN